MTSSEKEFVAREELSEEELKKALQACADEPIHRPNFIQPHGFIIIADADAKKILQVSENIDVYLGINHESCIGQSLESILPHKDIDKIRQTNFTGAFELAYGYMRTQLNGQTFDVISHYQNDLIYIEVEPVSRHELPNLSLSLQEQVRQFALSAQQLEQSEKLNDLLVKAIRDITGFDRVKLYVFDENWNGNVVAEQKADHMPSYKGLWFPAEDIPEQARKLYTLNYLRIIPDIRYQPSPLYPNQAAGSEQALDMTYSVLRSVSPVHIQYLANIDILGSMSISILQDGKLWGLVACHNSSAKFLSYQTRVTCEILAHTFSAKLSTLRKLSSQQKLAFQNILISRLGSSPSQVKGGLMAGNYDLAMEAIHSDSLVVIQDRQIESFGEPQPQAFINELCNWYQQQSERKVVHTNDCSELFKDNPILSEQQGGVLIIPVGLVGQEMAIWFRKAVKQTVNWAGNPEKSLTKTKAGYRLTPRSSFELWQATVKNRCHAWSDEDIETAEAIVQVILENEKIQAELANTAKTEFLSHMSHELRTPLGAIISIVQLLSADGQINHEQAKLIASLEVSADTLMSLINDLLDISKVEANEMDIDQSQLNLGDLMEDMRSMMAVKATEKGLFLNIDYKDIDSFIFEGDKLKIRQIIINLINNAIKFTERGGINIFAQIDDNKPESAHFRQVKIEVIDSGIGIAEDKLHSIFDKFVQADNTISRSYGGTGLGLAICKSFAELLGGDIQVQSQVGLGTKFSVTLPLKVVDRGEGARAKAIAVPDKKQDLTDTVSPRFKILLVEDYEGNIIAVLNFLQREGFEVQIARNGKDAVDLVQHMEFDCILMDVQMPIMDGLTATQIIREMIKKELIADTPVIGMTANALKEDEERCRQAGMQDYLSKPVRLINLKEKILQAVLSKQ